jgi:hypothetical protein
VERQSSTNRPRRLRLSAACAFFILRVKRQIYCQAFYPGPRASLGSHYHHGYWRSLPQSLSFPTHSNSDSNNNSYWHYSSALSNRLTTPTSSCCSLDSNSSSGSMEGQDHTQQPGFQGFPPSSNPPSCIQSAATGGSGWIDTTWTQQPQWGAEQHILLPPGTPLQLQPPYTQQPQFQQPQYAQPQYYVPPPDFSGILHMLAQSVSVLTQNSIATQQAMTTLLAKHASLSKSIQHLNLSNQ